MIELSKWAQSKYMAWGCVLVWMAVIFAFSAQPYSGEITGEYLGTFNFPVRKAAHMTEYGILFLLLKWALTTTPPNIPRSLKRFNNGILPFIFTVLYAMSDEFHQQFVPGRTATLHDVGMDSAGALVAWIGHYYLLVLKSCWLKTRS